MVGVLSNEARKRRDLEETLAMRVPMLEHFANDPVPLAIYEEEGLTECPRPEQPRSPCSDSREHKPHLQLANSSPGISHSPQRREALQPCLAPPLEAHLLFALLDEYFLFWR